MKKLLPLFLLFPFIKGYSQTYTITQTANQPLIGDTSKYYIIDTSAYSSGLNVANTGSNAVWNYTNLITTSGTRTTSYVSPTVVPNSSNYPGCTIVSQAGPLNSYFKSVVSPSTQLEFMGISSSSLNMNFSNSAIYMVYPFSYGNTVTDNFSGTFTFSLSGTASGNATITADGAGTLNLPDAVLTNVLRVKSVQNTNFSAFPLSGSLKQTVYSFYHVSQKYPIMEINYQTTSIAGSPTVTAFVTGNKNVFVLGVNENNNEILKLNIYPNPAAGLLNIEMSDAVTGGRITVYNQLGQIVLEKAFEKSTDISSLSNGIYLVEVKTNKGISRKKIVKE